MRNITFLKIINFSASVVLLLILLVACALFGGKTPTLQATSLSPTVQTTPRDSITSSLLAEWEMEYVNDIAWSPDSEMFVVNSQLKGNKSNSVQAFDVKSLNRMWIAKNSPASGLAFSPNGQLIAESHPLMGILYLRSAEQGDVVREIKRVETCNGGWFILSNPGGNTFLVEDPNGLTGLNMTGIIHLSLWDLDTGQCKNLLQYSGNLHLFDVNSSGNLIVYGGVGRDGHAVTVIWDEKKQAEVCRTKADFGYFVPGQNTLTVFRDQKIVFIDASSCQEFQELNIIPTFPTYFTFSPDGQLFAIVRESIQIIETFTGKIIAQIPLPENAAPVHGLLRFNGGLVFSPDGHYLLFAFSKNANGLYFDKIQLWQLLP